MSGYIFGPEIRNLLKKSLPANAISGEINTPESVYLPQSHVKALRPNSSLVVGIRGSGKSFWWTTLQNAQYRNLYGDDIGLSEKDHISVGFGEKPQPDLYPSRDVLEYLLKTTTPFLIWKMIIFKQLIESYINTEFLSSLLNQPKLKNFISLKQWADRPQWFTDNENIELIDLIFYQIDQYLEQTKTYHIFLFDALDRTAVEWKNMNSLVRGLLQNALDFQYYKRIRLKIFARPDQIEDTETRNFPDASKILSQRTDLIWPREELYALLWHYLANNKDNDDLFRRTTEDWYKLSWEKKGDIWIVPDQLRREDFAYQRELFHAITGPQMGQDTRRGYPYTWLINHLGDTRKQVSPRSFLTALRVASELPERSNYLYPIYYEAIKQGVQSASKIRVQEIEEDYPWVRDLFEPLRTLVVPCPVQDIESLWNRQDVLKKLETKINSIEVKLPPQHLQEGVSGVLRDLKDLGLVEFVSEDRVNIPDVYRVGYGMGRKGGIKPAAR